MVITDEIKELFEDIRVLLGAPKRTVEIDDDTFCRLLKQAVSDYAEITQQFIIESNWLNMTGKNQVQFLNNPQDLAYALTTRAMDWSLSYQQWCSKEVGLQQRGTNPKYELKKDFIKVIPGQQCYIIPAGREVNRVMWITPSTTKAAMFAQNGGMGFNMDTGLGMAQFGGVGTWNGMYGCFGSTFDIGLYAATLKENNKFLRSDLAYKITLGPNGTHILHLLSVPGPRNPNTFGNAAHDDKGWGAYRDCYVWYDYYDVSTGDVNECRLEHRDTLILSPSDIPLEAMQYELMNYQTQQTVRQLLYAHACLYLSKVYGKYNGKVKIPNAEMDVNWGLFRDEGKEERNRVITELKERYSRMLPWMQSENMLKLAQNTLDLAKTKPLVGFYIR